MKSTASDALRITDQFRAKSSMNYDLRSPVARLRLVMTARANMADEGDWRIDASSDVAGSQTITGWGATRIEALAAVANHWNTHGTGELPVFDWVAVEAALAQVRAV